MATVTRENIGTLHDKISVTVSAADYQSNFEKSLKNYAKNANIPGFRKGMVPAGLIRKMYGQSVFTEEVVKQAEKGLFDYLETEKLNIFAQPLPLDMEDSKIDMGASKDYTFLFEVGLKPEINIDSKGIKATRYKIEVTEEMINEDADRLLTRYGKMHNPETAEQDEDILNVTFTETNEAGEIVENGITKANSVLVKYFTSNYKQDLKGKKVGDAIIAQLSKAFEPKELEAVLADLGLTKDDADKYFSISISQIGRVEKAVLNEELFLAAYPNQEIKTEEEFRNAIKTEIENAFAAQTRNQLHDQIYHHLLDNTNINLPEAFLKRWLQIGGEQKKSAEAAETEYPGFSNSLKWTIISEELSKANDVKVEQEDIKKFAKQQLMGYMNMSSLDDSQPWIEEYALRMMKDKKFVEDSYFRIQTDKMFTAVESQITAKEESISFDDFSKKLHHHHH